MVIDENSRDTESVHYIKKHVPDVSCANYHTDYLQTDVGVWGICPLDVTRCKNRR